MAAGFSCGPSKRSNPREKRPAPEGGKWPREGSRRLQPAGAGAAIEGEAPPGEGSAAAAPPPSPPAAASLSPAAAFPPPTSPPPEEAPTTALTIVAANGTLSPQHLEAQCELGRVGQQVASLLVVGL